MLPAKHKTNDTNANSITDSGTFLNINLDENSYASVKLTL